MLRSVRGARHTLPVIVAGGVTTCGGGEPEGLSIGFIAKRTTNPFFIEAQRAAEAAAVEAGAESTAFGNAS